MPAPRWAVATALTFVVGCAHVALSPPGAATPQPQVPGVVLVQPNLLRISIRFDTPVEGPLLPRITLLGADGREIREPFLEQELWSPDGRVLTVLMHPGRVKTGLNARELMGPILVEGDDVSLALDGLPIKRWTVGPADESGPVVSAWTMSAVQAGSLQPLTVTLDGPIDGRDADYLAIADAGGRRVSGRAHLAPGERVWMFTPDAPWQAGAYMLVVRGTLEDPAGNRPGSRFETSIYSPPDPAADVPVPFVIAGCCVGRRDR